MSHPAIKQSLRLLPFLFIAVYSSTALAQDYPGDTPVPASPAPKTSNRTSENNSANPACSIKYPPFARQHEVQGEVVVEYTMDENGNPKNVRVASRKLNKTSVRDRSGQLVDVTTVFDDAVLHALPGCRRPVSKYACPLPLKIQVPFNFQLSG